MTWLTLLLVFKIGFTAIVVSAPLLLMPAERVSSLYRLGADAVPLCRLYGVAVTALLVGYASGIAPAQHGVFPGGVVAMGIASNAGAPAVLLLTGRWRGARLPTFVFAAIAVALLASAVAPSAALSRIF